MGIKTGITDAAGPCLAAAIPVKNCDMVMILLNSQTMDHRWRECI